MHVDDAAAWLRGRAAAAAAREPYDLVCVDIADGSNRIPETFYSAAFLADVRASLAPHGVVCHNFHSGKADLDRRLEEACAAYGAAFPGGACRVPSPARRPWNTIVAASPRRGAFSSLEELRAAARRAREQRGLPFDASARLEGLREIL